VSPDGNLIAISVAKSTFLLIRVGNPLLGGVPRGRGG
jgi:hypothetical protein